MKDKHTINLILISSRWLIFSFGVWSRWINSSSKCFHLFFSGVPISSAISLEPPSKSLQALILFFHPSFYLIILLLPEFFMVVLHDLIHSFKSSSRFCCWSSSIFSSHLKVQLSLRILLKWSFAFLRSSKLSNHFHLWSVITS